MILYIFCQYQFHDCFFLGRSCESNCKVLCCKYRQSHQPSFCTNHCSCFYVNRVRVLTQMHGQLYSSRGQHFKKWIVESMVSSHGVTQAGSHSFFPSTTLHWAHSCLCAGQGQWWGYTMNRAARIPSVVEPTLKVGEVNKNQGNKDMYKMSGGDKCFEDIQSKAKVMLIMMEVGRGVREGLSDKMLCEHWCKERVGSHHMDSWGHHVQAKEERVSVKTLQREHTWCIKRTVRRLGDQSHLSEKESDGNKVTSHRISRVS